MPIAFRMKAKRRRKKHGSSRISLPNKYGHRSDRIYLVLEVGLEPTKPKGGRFTVSCDCHYTIPARGAAFRIRTEDLLFTKQLL